jgi:hypothetical protein
MGEIQITKITTAPKQFCPECRLGYMEDTRKAERARRGLA